MICPRCGTQAPSDQPRCSRCAGILAEPELRDGAPVAVIAAPTRRGELLQATSGTVTVSLVELARAKKAAASPPVAPADPGQGSALGAPVGAGLWPSPPGTPPPPAAQPSPLTQPTPAASGPYPGPAPSPGSPAPYPGAGVSGQPANPAPTTAAPGPAWTSPEAAAQPWPPPPAPTGHWPQPPQPDGGVARAGDRAAPRPTTPQPAVAEAPVWSPIDGSSDRAPRAASGSPARPSASAPPSPAAPNPLRVRSESPAHPDPDAPWNGSSPGWAAPSGERWLARSLPATYWWQALVMLLLVPPVGVAALYFSWQVTRRVGLGDGPGAVRASRLARTCCLLGAFVFALAVVVYTGTHPK